MLVAGGLFLASCARDGDAGESGMDGPDGRSPIESREPSGSGEYVPAKDCVLVEIVEGESGTVHYRVDGTDLDEECEESRDSASRHRALEAFLVRRKEKFRPASQTPFLRVLVRQGRDVDFKEVLFVLKICEKAGMTNIKFESAPDAIEEEFERLEREKETAKHK